MKPSDIRKFWRSKKREIIDDYANDVEDGTFDEVVFSIEHELDVMTDDEFGFDVSEKYETYDDELRHFVLSLEFDFENGSESEEDDY